jgi:radical SAM superfamily enzyme YgiQ (UPF0313 family)
MVDKYSIEYYGHGVAEPIGLAYLSSFLSVNKYEVFFRDQYELEVTIPAFPRKLSLFSSISSEWNKVLVLNHQAKLRGNITIVGGYHVTGLFRDGESIDFDYAVIGEGEEIIEKVINDVRLRKSFGNEVTRYFFATPIMDLDKLPYPERNEFYLKNYKILDLMWPAASEQVNTVMMLASRGCYHHCSFCASHSMWGTGIRLRSSQNIIDEIKEIKRKYRTNTFIFIDQALGQDFKWTKELCLRMIDEQLNINWYLQTNITIKRELIPLLAEAGCAKIGFGIEGIAPSVMENIKPVNRMALDEMNDLFALCNHNGLFVKAYLMLGFPTETKEIINEYYRWITKLRTNVIKISFFTPFPGTPDWDKYKGQLVTHNWDHFDTVQMPVVRNPEISVEEYLAIRQKLLQAFYCSDEYKETARRILEKYPHYQISYDELFGFLTAHDMVPEGMTRNEWLPMQIFETVECCS